MSIGIFTPYSLDPIHPRLEMLCSVLKQHGLSMSIINNSQKTTFFSRWGKRLFLGFYDIAAVLKSIKAIDRFDLIYVQDMAYLPLILFAKIKGKIIIYETLDNNVYLRFYNLVTEYSIFKNFFFIRSFFKKIEKFVSQKLAHCTIVNSKALNKYFSGKAFILYYSSPFEKMPMRTKTERASNKPVNFIYLGWFCKSKGALDIVRFIEKYEIDCWIFGTITEKEIRKLVYENEYIHFYDRMESSFLKIELIKLRESYDLLGFSLIKNVHYSFSTQESNKDIDYIAMGVPIIGNHRGPTESKILAGCGIFYENELEIAAVLKDARLRSQLAQNCKKLYARHYSQKNYESRLMALINGFAI